MPSSLSLSATHLQRDGRTATPHAAGMDKLQRAGRDFLMRYDSDNSAREVRKEGEVASLSVIDLHHTARRLLQ